MSDIEKYIWLFNMLNRLTSQNFSGTLILEFYKGDLSRKYKVQVTEIADV